MSQISTSNLTTPITPTTGLSHWYQVYRDITKARLAVLVLVTTAIGYFLANPVNIQWDLFLITIIGTALAAACANMFNQIMEIPRDARMPRTQNRPLPSKRIGKTHAIIAAAIFGITGVTMLALFVNLLTASLGLLTIILYLAVYTPLKTRTTHNTLVGAVCGALPPVMGWTAVNDSIGHGAWLLAAILFIWQIPHFLALAWLYREDYAIGGYRMLPVIDEAGNITTASVVLWSIALLPVGFAGMFIGISGWFFVFSSLALGAWFIAAGIKLRNQRTNENARRVFLVSVMYLPLLLGAMAFDHYTFMPSSMITDAQVADNSPQPLTPNLFLNTTQPPHLQTLTNTQP